MKRFGLYSSIVFLFFFHIMDTCAFEFDEFGSIETHGYISQGYLQSDENNYFLNTKDGDTDFYEVGISLTTDVSDRLRMGIQMLSYSLGDFGDSDFHVNWASADYDFKRWLSFRAGKMKIYHGLFNRNRDADFLRTNILLPQSIYNEAWRSTISAANGIEIYGSVEAGFAGRLTYNFQGGKTKVDPEGGVGIAAKEKLLEKSYALLEFVPLDVQEKLAGVGRLSWETPIRGLNINVTSWFFDFDMIGPMTFGSQLAPNSVFKTSAQSTTGSIMYTLGDFQFISEYSFSKYDFEVMSAIEIINQSSDLETEGYYANVIYRFTDWLETGVYYSVYYPDRGDQDGSTFTPIHAGWQKDTCLSFRFDLSDNWVFKLEGHAINGTAVMMKVHNGIDYDPKNIDLKEDWLLFGAKLTFSF